METIIIDGRRELKDLPELWYTDGTDEANEWGKAVFTMSHWMRKFNYVGSDSKCNANGTWHKFVEHEYITPSEFIRLVYEPWKERQKVKLPKSYEELKNLMYANSTWLMTGGFRNEKHINACIQLTNIMNFANDAFEGEGKEWVIWSDGIVPSPVGYMINHPIRFTSKAGAEWAYNTFPEIFKAYWNV
jgi:hypothetical protein